MRLLHSEPRRSWWARPGEWGSADMGLCREPAGTFSELGEPERSLELELFRPNGQCPDQHGPRPQTPAHSGVGPGYLCFMRLLGDPDGLAPLASAVLSLDTQLGWLQSLLFVLSKQCSRPRRTGREVAGQHSLIM